MTRMNRWLSGSLRAFKGLMMFDGYDNSVTSPE